jgi:hypothetical protein
MIAVQDKDNQSRHSFPPKTAVDTLLFALVTTAMCWRRKQTGLVCILLYCTLFAFVTTSAAETNVTLVETMVPKDDYVDTTHQRITKVVLTSSGWIDSFFRDEQATYEETSTYLRLRLTNTSQEGELLKIHFRPRIHLDLPLYRENLRLFLSTEDDKNDRFRLPLDEQVADIRQPPSEHRATTGLRYFLRSTIYNHATINVGMRFYGIKPVAFLEPRYRHTVRLDDWNLSFTQRFTLRSDDRQIANTRIDLERPLHQLFFRTSLVGNWYDNEKGYYYGHHFNLFQPISRNRILRYGWSNFFVTRPAHAFVESRLLVSYRQRIWKEWFFVEITPQIAFPREDDYAAAFFLFLQLDIIFGGKSSFRI